MAAVWNLGPDKWQISDKQGCNDNVFICWVFCCPILLVIYYKTNEYETIKWYFNRKIKLSIETINFCLQAHVS